MLLSIIAGSEWFSLTINHGGLYTVSFLSLSLSLSKIANSPPAVGTECRHPVQLLSLRRYIKWIRIWIHHRSRQMDLLCPQHPIMLAQQKAAPYSGAGSQRGRQIEFRCRYVDKHADCSAEMQGFPASSLWKWPSRRLYMFQIINYNLNTFGVIAECFKE